MSARDAGPRIYKNLPIAKAVIIKPEKYKSKPEGWVAETADFSELSYFLGKKFEARTMYENWSPEGIGRGGHIEGRNRLMTAVRGKLYTALIDMRPGPEQGKIFECYLGDYPESDGLSILIPEGVIGVWFAVDGEGLAHFVADKPYNKFENVETLDVFDKKLELNLPKTAKKMALEEGEREVISLEDLLKKVND